MNYNKVCPEEKPKYKYRRLWQAAVKRIVLHLRIIKIMRPENENRDQRISEFLIDRTAILHSIQTKISLPFFILQPEGRFKESWNLFIGFLLIYTATVTPFTLSFMEITTSDWLFDVDIIVDISFIMDFVFNLNTAFFDEDNILVFHRGAIICNYLKKGFFLDLISSFPFTLVDLSTKGYSNIFRIFRLRALSKLMKLSRLFKVIGRKDYKILKDLQIFLSISHSFVRLVKFISMIIISIHIAACLWHWAAKFNNFSPGTWIFESGNTDSPIYRRYIISLYWTFQTLSTVGYGDIHAYSIIEKIISILWMTFALYFLSFSISSLSSMLSQIDYKKTMLRQKMGFIDEFSKEVKLSKRLKKELQKTLLSSIDRFSYSYNDRIALVNEFPKELKLEIAYSMHKGQAVRFDIFQGEDDNLLLEILPLMQNLSVPGMQTIYSYGESSNKIYFLIRGRIHFLLSNEKTVFQVFTEGGYFGDIEALSGIPRLNSAVTATECNFIIMGSDILYKLQSHFPKFYFKIKEASKKRYEISNRAKAEMRMLVEISKTDCITRQNLFRVKDIIRRETLKYAGVTKFGSKYVAKVSALENLTKTAFVVEDCNSMLKDINMMIEQLGRKANN